MYVVLQGIGSPSCMIIIYVIPFGEQQSWMSEVRKLERFNNKNGSPEMIYFFLYCIKKWIFQAHRGVPPTTGVVELWKKTSLQWRLMELVCVPKKMVNYFRWKRAELL